jgi:hypothetical protein
MKNLILSLSLAASLLPCYKAAAQEVDLNQEPIKDLYFDWVGAAPASNMVGVYRDITYWNLFAMRMKGWNGGNDCNSISLPDGNVLWTFGDSYFGRISEFRNRMQYNNRPHNAAQVQIQRGELYGEDDFVTLNEYVSTSQNNPMYYYKGKDWVRHPDAKLSQNDIDLGLIDDAHYLRPEDGTVVLSGGETRIQQIFSAYNKYDEHDGLYIVEFGLQGDPREKGYIMELSKVKMPYVADFGHAILEDGGRNYLYGTVRQTAPAADCVVVARTQNRSLKSQWEYYVKDETGSYNWQTDVPTLEQLRNSKISGPTKAYGPSVFKYGNDYFMVSQAGFNGAIQISKSDNPWGPFRVQRRIYNIRRDEAVANHVFVHPQLSRMGELVVSYVTEPEGITLYTQDNDGQPIATELTGEERNRNGWGSASLNQPHFLRIFNWQNLFSVEDTGAMQDALLSEWDSIDAIQAAALSDGGIKIYPTSVSTAFSIDTPQNYSYKWIVTSLAGGVVKKGDAKGNTLVNVADLAKGAYVVTVGEGSGRTTAKIIKQ